MHRYARSIVGLSHQSSNLSHLDNLLWKVVIHALLDTGFKGIQVVTYLSNCQTTKIALTKVFPKRPGECTWINKVDSSSWIYSFSMRGTNIAKVEGQWLDNQPSCSVPDTQMTAPRLMYVLLMYFPPPKSMRDHCDFTLWHHNCLLYSFGGKTTVHVQRRCHSLSVHLMASLPESPVTIATPKPHPLFLIPNFMPVTLSPRYFGVPLYWSLDLFTMSTTKHRHI